MAGELDVVVKGGHVLDVFQGVDGLSDVGVRAGKVVVVGQDLDAGQAAIIDARGLVVTPGLIDLHVHVWQGVANLGIEADPHCVRRGVTTVYDAGSAGSDTYEGLQKYVIDVSATRIKAFLHISSQGQLNRDIGELTDLRYADVESAVKTCEQYRDSIVGIKIRMTKNLVGDNGREGLKRARAVCEATGLPLMLHPNDSPLSLAEMLEQMKAGDIMTHCFHQSDTGILAAGGEIRAEARKAVERGILFDVGHGAGSFSYEIAETAMAQGVLPGTISSDLHKWNLQGPVYDLATTVSKFMLLGWSLQEAVEKVTVAPARAMGVLGEIGTLAPGACADIALFELREEPRVLVDAVGEERVGEQWLLPIKTLRAGAVFEPI